MKTRACIAILAVIALMPFSLGALAQSEHQHGAQKSMKHDMSTMDMSSMMNEPHHALAMAYMQSIGTFATTLHNQAEGASPLDATFARAAVAEIRRSLDQMEEHHAEHVKTMSEKMRSHMAVMMKDMDMERMSLKDAVSTLEKDVRAELPDSKQVAADSADLLKHCDKMSKMHDDMNGKKMKK